MGHLGGGHESTDIKVVTPNFQAKERFCLHHHSGIMGLLPFLRFHTNPNCLDLPAMQLAWPHQAITQI